MVRGYHLRTKEEGGETMRATTHNGRAGKSGAYKAKHCDRKFDLNKAEHINQQKTNQNFYWHYLQNEHPELNFEEVEQLFYEQHFSESLQARNDCYMKHGNSKYVKTMKQYIQDKRTCPEEQIWAIGKKGDTISASMLRRICTEQFNWEQMHFPSIKILNYCVHVDEKGIPHVHKRQVYIGHDKVGREMVGQNKALQEMNILRPDVSTNQSRYNNSKQTYTSICRNHFLQICHEHGLTIDTQPQERSRTGLKLTEYMAQQEEQKMQDCIDLCKRLKTAESNSAEIVRDLDDKARSIWDSTRKQEDELRRAIENAQKMSRELEAENARLAEEIANKRRILMSIEPYLNKGERLKALNELAKAEDIEWDFDEDMER